MSTVKRLISGSASAWARIAVTVISQVAVVPFFLSRWDIQTYGTWIAIQALVIVCSTLDRGHNDFLEYEFLKIGNGERKKIRTYLWSGVSIVVVIAVAELLLLSFFCLSGGVQFLVDGLSNSNNNFAHEVAWSIIVGWITWSVTNIAGLFARCLFGFGYFPRMGWWNVLLAIVGTLAPVIATLNKGGLLDASIWACCGSLIVLFFQFIDMKRLLKKEKINRDPANWKLGWKNYFTSLGLSIRYFLENFRQQGIRILLVPLSGAAALTAFATMRTGANVDLAQFRGHGEPAAAALPRHLAQRRTAQPPAGSQQRDRFKQIGLARAILTGQQHEPRARLDGRRGIGTEVGKDEASYRHGSGLGPKRSHAQYRRFDAYFVRTGFALEA